MPYTSQLLVKWTAHRNADPVQEDNQKLRWKILEEKENQYNLKIIK